MPTPRTQTGVRVYSPLLKTLKAMSEYLDMSLSDLMEGLLLHGLENKPAFSNEQLTVVARLKEIYGCDWTAEDSHMHPDDEG